MGEKSYEKPRTWVWWATALLGAAVWLLFDGTGSAWAQEDPATTTTQDLSAVVERLRNVIVSLAMALATLFLTVGGLRWMLAGGDSGEIDAAKRALKGAGIGYAIALLATVLMTVLNYVVKGTTQ
ncbi:hypothetical protein HDA32_005597 [Spinactinospora alkalitolerans]|uniref:Uncharacterized protein n=1 Tax=Spinactinospora alkalitolerans TaxID=687207 RepID=A0A852U4E8_9ACTN|nr:pilin [Spinactinospora alkalitolerans]NYE50477.1 hypothetical protein [Spinactinospora alkalitolerans]